MIWSPLGGGRLFGNTDEQPRRVREVLAALGAPYGAAPATVAYAWILRHPSRPVPVTGTGRIEGLREAVAGAGPALERRGLVPDLAGQHRLRSALIPGNPSTFIQEPVT
jgi:predicted oxidoreductase